jgi:hypothetical protein
VRVRAQQEAARPRGATQVAGAAQERVVQEQVQEQVQEWAV